VWATFPAPNTGRSLSLGINSGSNIKVFFYLCSIRKYYLYSSGWPKARKKVSWLRINPQFLFQKWSHLCPVFERRIKSKSRLILRITRESRNKRFWNKNRGTNLFWGYPQNKQLAAASCSLWSDWAVQSSRSSCRYYQQITIAAWFECRPLLLNPRLT